MSPVLSPVPVVWPVSSCGIASAGRSTAGETLTVALREDTLKKLVETPAQAPNQLENALSVFYRHVKLDLKASR